MTNNLIVISAPQEAALILCGLDQTTGHLSPLDRVVLPVEGICSGTPLAVNADRSRLYLSWRGTKPQLLSFAIDAVARTIEYLGTATLPGSMCYAQVTSCGRRILTASYPDSTIAISAIDSNGCAGEPVMVQDCAHAHCIVEAPNGRVYTTSLKGDVIRIHAFDRDRNDLTQTGEVITPNGSGPRHLVFTRDGTMACLLSEFSGSLSSYAVEPGTGMLRLLHGVTMTDDQPKPWGAELRLSHDERFLYASERRSSQLFSFRLSADGTLSRVAQVAGPDCPRAFSLDASGTYLIALGEKDGQVRVYLSPEDGSLTPLQKMDVGAGPSWAIALPG